MRRCVFYFGAVPVEETTRPPPDVLCIVVAVLTIVAFQSLRDSPLKRYPAREWRATRSFDLTE
jgi:hypothetical protein